MEQALHVAVELELRDVPMHQQRLDLFGDLDKGDDLVESDEREVAALGGPEERRRDGLECPAELERERGQSVLGERVDVANLGGGALSGETQTGSEEEFAALQQRWHLGELARVHPTDDPVETAVPVDELGLRTLEDVQLQDVAQGKSDPRPRG